MAPTKIEYFWFLIFFKFCLMDGINEHTAHKHMQYDVSTHIGYLVLDQKKMIFVHHGTT